jgi:hypothetical protein
MGIISNLPFDIEEKEVLRLQKVAQPRGKIKGVLANALREGYSLAEPRAAYVWLKVNEVNESSLILEGGFRLSGGISLWKGAEYLALALCTIGSQLEDRVSELFDGEDYACALMLDSAGSVAVESVADRVNLFICEEANRLGLETGPRLSPGYEGWSLEDQKVIFVILPSEKVGVCLTEQYMMIPRKSISFCVGIGRGLGSGERVNPCRHCSLKDCPYRRLIA